MLQSGSGEKQCKDTDKDAPETDEKADGRFSEHNQKECEHNGYAEGRSPEGEHGERIVASDPGNAQHTEGRSDNAGDNAFGNKRPAFLRGHGKGNRQRHADDAGQRAAKPDTEDFNGFRMFGQGLRQRKSPGVHPEQDTGEKRGVGSNREKKGRERRPERRT